MLFTEQEKEEIIKGMQMMHRQHREEEKRRKIALNRYKMFQIYVDAGFNKEQALKLVIADIENEIKYKNVLK